MILQATLANDMRDIANEINLRLAHWPEMDPQEAPFAAMQESAAILMDAAGQIDRGLQPVPNE